MVLFRARETGGPAGLDVLLVRRGRTPFAGRHALPGGFLEIDEPLVHAARRELREETGLFVSRLVEVGAFGAPDRDPRGRTISVAFAGFAIRPRMPAGGDDAAVAEWCRADPLPALAFDHRKIVRAARETLTRAIRLDGTLRALLPPQLRLDDLQRAHEAVLGTAMPKAALRRRLERAGLIADAGDGRVRIVR